MGTVNKVVLFSHLVVYLCFLALNLIIIASIVSLSNCQLINNYASSSGGALYMTDFEDFKILNSRFERNDAES